MKTNITYIRKKGCLLKYLLLYVPNSSNYFVISCLEKKLGKIFKIAEIQTNSDVLKRTLNRKKDPFLSKINKLFFYIFYFIFLKNRVNNYIDKKLDYPTKIKPAIFVRNINEDKAILAAKTYKPDIILVLGTGLLNRKWLDLGKPILNAHTGIMPFYRGRFCWFWPIVNEEFDKVGVSVHEITPRADSGKILSQEFIKINNLDSILFETILEQLPPLIYQCFYKSIQKIQLNKDNNHRNNQENIKIISNIYFEPGITDYLKFLKVCKKY